MPFVSVKSICDIARKRGYGIGFFTVNSLETVQAVIECAEELRSPVVLAPWQEDTLDIGFGYIEAISKYAIENSSVPASLHLDHGTNYEFLVKCLTAGYSSVMFDGAHLKLEENITLTKKIADLAHIVGVTVEGEVGTIASKWEMSEEQMAGIKFTDPDEAEEYVKRTGVDSLAISVGTRSGAFMERPEIDFGLLSRIRQKVDVHLVIHGGSSMPLEDVRRAVELGVTYMKFGSVIRNAFFKKIDEIRRTNPPDMLDTRYILTPAKEEMKKIIKERILRLGSNGRADDRCDFACRTSSGESAREQKPIRNLDVSEAEIKVIVEKVVKNIKDAN
ncbi:MAG: class II fructose-bisphosphate aldolase [Actinobacteria bacterium]|nr:class II fructose-bisphosphate aldolase [Actinomycetota bacterium]